MPKLDPQIVKFLAGKANIPVASVPLLSKKNAFAILESIYREGLSVSPDDSCGCKYCSAARLVIEQSSLAAPDGDEPWPRQPKDE
jgi:hypothetical protein